MMAPPSHIQGFVANLNGDMEVELPEVTTASVIGITVAIAGNVLISLALNVQKLAHKRLEREKYDRARDRIASEREAAAEPNAPAAGGPGELDSVSELGTESTPTNDDAGERDPLISTQPQDPGRNYGSRSTSVPSSSDHPQRSESKDAKPRQALVSIFNPFGFGRGRGRRQEALSFHDDTESGRLLPVDVIVEEPPTNGKNGKHENGIALTDEEDGNESDYLKSKLWWLGFALMNVGELGNFISYAFAPASVVAPLGTFALMANCIFAPVMLKERFRKLDLIGILIAVIGAVTVVLASNTSDVRLDPVGLLRAISQRVFIVYACIYVAGAAVLATLSAGEAGRRYVFVDVGLCALFGGFTVLSTKGVSTLLTLEWIDMFTEWITYPVIIVLIGTGVGQIRYLNRALMRFDSKVVIPIQFVLFNLSAIVGSAILYGDFKKATFHQFITFLYGCGATFAGVFIVAWGPSSADLAAEDGNEHNASTAVSEEDTRLGTVGRSRTRATLLLPPGTRDGSGAATPILRKKHSAVGVGLSPAQHLLLVHTPPHEGFVFPTRDGYGLPTHRPLLNHAPNHNSDPNLVRGDPYVEPQSAPDSIGRRRAVSAFGEGDANTAGRSARVRRAVTGIWGNGSVGNVASGPGAAGTGGS
ncbi:hypothetical protein PLICRDRAFT_693597 [Plicaturopsis crispa FD-325 SS-3]|nr:hypothetical protein PLICRDRAFT_693597 [Plicaturopsis crispa FD-325 SS-3]